MAALSLTSEPRPTTPRKEPRSMTQPEPWVIATFAANTKSIQYARDLGWTGSKMATFRYHSPSDVRVTYGYDTPPQIGVWRTTLDPALIASAQQVLRASNYETIPGTGPHRPDTKFVGFQEEPTQGGSQGFNGISAEQGPARGADGRQEVRRAGGAGQGAPGSGRSRGRSLEQAFFRNGRGAWCGTGADQHRVRVLDGRESLR